MAQVTLTESRWLKNRRTDAVQQDPSPAQLADALARSDGREQSEVTLERGDGTSLIVGGGTHGRYVVSYFLNEDGDSLTLQNPDGDADRTEQIVVGGQAGDFSEKILVDRATALRAAIAYAATGAADPGLPWSEA